MNISKFVTPEIIFGCGSLSQVGESARRLGASKVFVVSDEGVIGAGWVEKALHYLHAAGLKTSVFSALTTNPKDLEVTEGAARYLASGCDAIAAVGGGSPTDVAKAVAILVTNGGSTRDYEGINRIHRPLPPMLSVPSTAGAGSEVSQFAIIIDTERRLKMSIISKSLVPDIAIVDPELLCTKDARLAAATGVDALTHGIESYVSLAGTHLTEIHALKAIELIARYLRRAVADRDDLEANTHMAMASLSAGIAFSNAILGATHAMAHQVDGQLDQHHGESNAALLPHVMEFNLPACPERFQKIASAFGKDVRGLAPERAAVLAITAVRELLADVGLDQGLAALGLNEAVIPELSRNALRDACLVTNPREASRTDLEDLFRRAL
ncbi:iron-containing alcohol dehydrogenase [Geoalkalibacter halelectricus]|uniref:Iron-containing alcohol dehydrogenase n=1 Tax=Geoalkalibacter halelectricus TaxID=2847045 RepID=A0ABY5ZM69_9BACT|nr:iron-containing alcohol dehydrogenase [Geoalkalibacter halelectricus]MDO3377287.1 iron-containing alcohol dehydrogenase [Geoalkalibacter halelectricus]UWZ78925.1 iron-containing alcohol dehydrogenase [Geoalkalibacter halelectricus]